METLVEHFEWQNASLARMLRRILDGSSDEEFVHPPGGSAPPIGWHLWHVARWSDRFQATLKDRDGPIEIWTSEGIANDCGLDPEQLGVLQLGMSMDAALAQALPRMIGKERFGAYLERVLDALSIAIAGCVPSSLFVPRVSIREYAEVNGVIQYAVPQESTLLADVLFHLTHSSRHIGSIEALRGL